MRIDAASRTATLSVGDFASFRPYAMPGFGGIAAVWRAQLGTQWHQRIQADSAAAGEGMVDEIPIQGQLLWRGWTLFLNGRIDQMKTVASSQPTGAATTHLREIKTLSEPLPLSRDAILERYLSYPIQLLTYRDLLLAQHPTPNPQLPAPAFRLELLFVEIGSGLTQSIPLDSSYDALLVDQLDTLVDYLESQQERLARLRSLAVNPAYPTPRRGQETIQQDLDRAFELASLALLEAPTGYGKTGVAWEQAARRLASGQADRALYLTSKATGQTEAVERLRALLAATSQSEISDFESRSQQGATFWQIRNKQEHCIHTEFRCSPQTCPYLANLNEKWKRSGLQRLYLLSHDEISIDTLKSEGRATGICPYEIMRAGLGYRDIWIGDYNYLFSPGSARLLDEQADFDPARTFLIIDEAHNLPSRVASAFTFEISLHAAYAAADDLRESRASSRIQNLLKSLASLIASLPTANKRDATNASPIPQRDVDDFSDHLVRLSEAVAGEALPYQELLPETSDLLFNLLATQSAQSRGELQHLLWSPDEGIARLECIDASKLIAARISQYGGVLALSATLSPLESFLEDIGLPDALPIEIGATDATAKPPLQLSSKKRQGPPVARLRPPAPWREQAYDVAIDLRVNTRFKSRDRHLAASAATIAAAAEKAAPAIVFFPSYAYAQKCYEQIQVRHPAIRVALQPRSGGSLADREAYLEEALAFHDALFLILGSSYAEGVDALGGKAGSAIVVSPALPEMNFIQETKRQRHERLARNGFERAYLQPGIQKVNQALGRLIRAPGQKVKALLHCERFAEPKTRNLLDPLYQTKTYIQTDAELQEWLATS